MMLIVCFSEVITIIDYAISAKNMNVLSDRDVFGFIVLLFCEAHTWIVCKDGLFRELLLSQKERERIPT